MIITTTYAYGRSDHTLRRLYEVRREGPQWVVEYFKEMKADGGKYWNRMYAVFRGTRAECDSYLLTLDMQHRDVVRTRQHYWES